MPIVPKHYLRTQRVFGKYFANRKEHTLIFKNSYNREIEMWVTSFYCYLRTSGINKADSGSQHISEQDQRRGVKMAVT